VPGVQPGRAAAALALTGQGVVLGVLATTAGIGPWGWVVAMAAQVTVVDLLARGLRRSAAVCLGPANRVTLVRSVLTCTVAGLVASSFQEPVPAWLVAGPAAAALALDAVDGQVARRTGSVTRLGARFDMEVDALLILVLSGYVGRSVGWWVLSIGLARYLLLAAQHLAPPLRGDVAPRRWRKVVAAVQGVVLVAATAGLLPGAWSSVALGVALALLAASFGTEAVEPRTARSGADSVSWRAAVLTTLSLVLVWVALATPDGDRHLTTWLVLRVPLEGVGLVAVAAFLPHRWAGRLGTVVGALAAVVLVLKVVDVGFTLVLDRRFDVIGDWFYLGSAFGVLTDSVGRAVALLAVAGVLVIAAGLCVLLPLAGRRSCHAARRHRRTTVALAAGLTALASLLTLAGIGPAPYHRSVSTASAGLVVDEVVHVRADLRDRSVFASQIADDPLARTGPPGLLERLRGKDVLVVFVESYGRSALQNHDLAPGVTAALEEGTQRLRGAGYSSRSAFLTSPTFGAASWLAHSTLQSGLWVDSQRRYSQLIGSDRLTLAGAFHRAGWRTVFDVPSVTHGWSEGQRFYGFDELYDAGNVGYRGPRFGYATMPDQYTLAHLRETELTSRPRQPVMAEVDLVSSHHPWAPLPHLVPWSQVGDGSVYRGMPERGATADEVFRDARRVPAAYAQSIEYSLDSLVSFVLTSPDPDLVVLMLGDHQPHHYVSGADPGYDVPVTLIAHDPSVVTSIASWGWTAGLLPAPDAPVWRMDEVRDRFLGAFSAPGLPVEPVAATARGRR
jgi:phosphatidylglycerophosphate synthase